MFRITQCLSVGPFASPERAELLRAAGVTHILNVSHEASEIIAAKCGFESVAWVPMSDSKRLRPETAVLAIDALHSMVSVPDSHVYVHCVAGLVRSPTILWLYLLSLGISGSEARKWIQGKSKMANAGSAKMVDKEHVLLVRRHGLANYFPLARPEVIVPFEVPSQGADAPRSG